MNKLWLKFCFHSYVHLQLTFTSLHNWSFFFFLFGLEIILYYSDSQKYLLECILIDFYKILTRFNILHLGICSGLIVLADILMPFI